MARILFAHLNRIDDVSTVLAGGSWSPSHPLDNLRNARLSRQARSSSAAPANTIVEADFGQARDIRVVALAGHNLSLASRIKVQLRTGPGGSGDLIAGHDDWADVWPEMFAGEVVNRPPTEEEIVHLPKISFHDLGQGAGRYLRIEMDDPGNPDGFVSIGRFWAGPAWQPSRNFAYGCQLGVSDETEIEASPGGAVYSGQPVRRRTARVSLDWLGLDEGYQQALDMSVRLGRTGQLLVCLDPAQGLNRLRQTLLCTLEASPLSLPRYGLASISLDFREVVA